MIWHGSNTHFIIAKQFSVAGSPNILMLLKRRVITLGSNMLYYSVVFSKVCLMFAADFERLGKILFCQNCERMGKVKP